MPNWASGMDVSKPQLTLSLMEICGLKSRVDLQKKPTNLIEFYQFCQEECSAMQPELC